MFPCKNCSERTCDCHGTCEKYDEAKKRHKELIEKYRRDDEAYIREVRSRANVFFFNVKKRRK